MDLRLKQLEALVKDKENALGNLSTFYHSEPFTETLKAKMKIRYFIIPKTPHGIFKAKVLQ